MKTMNPVIALFLSNSFVSAATDPEVTTVTNAVQSNPGTDPAASSNCTVDQANRPIINT